MSVRRSLPAAAVALSFAILFAAALSSGRGVFRPLPPSPVSPGAALWEGRTLEVLAQGAVLLAGVLGVLSVLRPHGGREEGA